MLEAFGLALANRDGRTNWCRDCFNAYARARNQQRREAGTPVDPERDRQTRYAVLKHRAAARALPFELTYERFRELTILPCHYCGGTAPIMGVDRYDNEVGYNEANAVPACGTCNTWKSTLSTDEFYEHLKRVYQTLIGGGTVDGEYHPPIPQRQWREVGERRPVPRLQRGRRRPL
jgi:hypothetical protein